MANAGDSLLRIERMNYLLGAILSVAALVLYPLPISLGVAVGVALTCINFAILRRLVFRWTSDAAKGVSTGGALLMLPKMVGLMGAVVIALAFLPINAIAFVVGFSVFLASIIVEAVYSAVSSSSESTSSSESDGPSDGSSAPPPAPSGPDGATSGKPSGE